MRGDLAVGHALDHRQADHLGTIGFTGPGLLGDLGLRHAPSVEGFLQLVLRYGDFPGHVLRADASGPGIVAQDHAVGQRGNGHGPDVVGAHEHEVRLEVAPGLVHGYMRARFISAAAGRALDDTLAWVTDGGLQSVA